MASGASVVRYLPTAIDGKQVLFQEAPDMYRVDLSVAFGGVTAGIVYRSSRNLEDRDPDRAAMHGETIPGRETQGWVEVEVAGSTRLQADSLKQHESLTRQFGSPPPSLNAFLLPGAGAPGSIGVSGCGSQECQGLYEFDGMMNGRQRYRSAQSFKTINYTSGWWLLAENYRGESWYAVQSKSDTPPTAGWICGHRGKAPPPMVELGNRERTPLPASVYPVFPPATNRASKKAEEPYACFVFDPTPTQEPSGFSCCGIR